MKLHKARQIELRYGTRYTTLCGRMNAQSVDGMNIVDSDSAVSCKLCLAKMKGHTLAIAAMPKPQVSHD